MGNTNELHLDIKYGVAKNCVRNYMDKIGTIGEHGIIDAVCSDLGLADSERGHISDLIYLMKD